MIEATCAACGTVNRMSEADVPVGAKFVSCTSCKSKVVLPAKAAPAPAPGKPAASPIAIPSIPRLTPPKGVPAAKAATSAKGLPAATKSAPPTADITDLPAPKRQSPLAGAESAAKPAPRSALSSLDSRSATGAELPAPKSGAKPPAPQPGALDLDDLMPEGASPAGLADLPAPKPRPSPLADLPAPKAAPKSALADLPAPKPKPAALTDLPAPKGLADLPTPKVPAAAKPANPPEITGLPAPKSGITDLPAPKGPSKGTLELDDDLELPMPKVGITDLPMPKPGANNDLLAPKGFFEDLPQPAKRGAGGTIDLPAPKGFFEDLPQPAQKQTTQDIAPKGFFEDLPQPGKNQTTQDIAPKGFFDDLPQPAKKQTQDVAPKGFFDDLPQPAKKQTQDVAPKGFFDDLPQPGKASTTQDLAPAGGAGLFDDLPNPSKPASAAGLFDDLQAPGQSAADRAMGAGDIDLGPATDIPGLELDTSGPELDLGEPLADGDGGAFQDLDLSEPTKPKPIEEGSPIKIKTPAKGASKSPIPIVVPGRPMSGGDLKLDLADDAPMGARGAAAAASTAAANKITPKSKAAAAADSPEARATKKRRSRLVLGCVLLVAALGAGGFMFYQRHAAAQRKAEAIEQHLQTAQQALVSDQPKHWLRASNAAAEALSLDGENPRALGIAAEALLAGALDTGINREARISQARAHLEKALGGATTPEVERAKALAAIPAKGQAGRAVDLLKAQIAKAPKDGWLQLYLGWAQLAKGDGPEAVKAFEQAMTATPGTKLSALYGQGQAKLMLADMDGAKDAFAKILEINKDHVCANVGLIATYPAAKSIEQVDELNAVLARKDIKTADPRCVVRAHTLIGDVHRAANRVELARQSYLDALKLVANDVETLVGLAALELRDNKPKVAADLIQKALAFSPDHAEAQLVQTELLIREGKLGDAEKSIDKLGARQPPLPPLSQAHLFVVRGKLAVAKGQDDDAIAAYIEAAKLAGQLDLTPTMLAVNKLTDLAKKASDPAKATEYRSRASALLQPLEANAQDDAQLSVALGIAYAEAGDFAKAETLLRRAVAMKGEDPEAKLQLAKALDAQGKTDDAISELKDAQKLDPKRTDIALQLAKTYQLANHNDEAIAAYDKLLALPNVATVVRVDAGRYFAKRGMIERAAGQAKPILDAEPDNPGGLYLEAEGLLKAGKPDEAALLLTKATDADPDAQYLDALGRALEARVVTDKKYIEGARAAYERASKADPKMFHPWLGQGKMRVANKDWDAAIQPLLEAAKLDKSSSDVMYNMALAYYGLGKSNPKYKATAAQWFESALRAQPELDLDSRGDAAWKLGDLYNTDEVNKPRDAIRAFETAIHLGEQLEKQGSPTPPWLVETYYTLGDLYYKTSNFPAQKRMFEKYRGRNPPPSERLKRVNNDLATSLQKY